MEYVYAAMLLHKAGKTIDEKSITGILKAAGIDADQTRVKALIASLDEVDIDEAIKSSPTLMPVTQTATKVESTKEGKPAEDKKEKDEKKKEEEAIEGLGALFG